MIRRLIGWLWSLLPDDCEMPGCRRQGIRGNEIIVLHMGRRMTVCDYCYADHVRTKNGKGNRRRAS